MKQHANSVNEYGTIIDGDTRQKPSKEHPGATVPEINAVRQVDTKDGWYGIGTFGKVGPCDSLRQAMIRSGT